MQQVFSIPMSRRVLGIFYVLLAVCAGATAWSFRSGLVWTGICIMAVAGPLGMLYWYMLSVNPGRARVSLGEENLQVTAPPFFQTTVPWDAVSRAERVDLRGPRAMDLGESVKSMRFGPYTSGEFTLPGGGKALVSACGGPALGVWTDDALLVLGPRNLDEFENALRRHLP